MDLPAIGAFLFRRANSADEIARSARGRRQAFESTYQDHFDFVWRTLVRLGVDPAEAEDAVQEVFLIAYRRWNDFEGRSAVRTWLFGVARRVASHHRRAQQRRQRRHQAFGRIAQDVVDGERLAHECDAAQRLRAFLDGLDEDKRAVFVLADLEGMSGREVAEMLGLKPNTAWSRLRAARAEFSRTFGGSIRKQTALLSEPPPDDARARVWGLILPQLPTLKVAAAGGSAATLQTWLLGANLKVFTVTVGAGTLAVGAAAVAVPAPVSAPVAERAGSSPSTARKRPGRAPVEIVTASVASSVPAPSPPPLQVPAALAPVVPGAPSVSVQVPHGARGGASARPKPTTEDPAPVEPPPEAEADPPPALPTDPGKPPASAAELRLLHQARGYLATKRPAMALLVLARHERDFPDGSLVRLRKVTRAEALCASDRRATGIGEAYRLVKDDREPRLVARLKRACGLKRLDDEEVQALEADRQPGGA